MWNLQARYCIYNCPEYTFSKYISNFIPKSLLDACDIELLLHGDRIHLESHATDLAQRWNRLEGDPDARLQFIETQKAKVEEINRFAPLWKEWASARAKARKNELKRMREKTLQSAVGRLRLMGWKDELNRLAQTDYAPLRQHNALRNRFKMTDCIWDNISDKLVELLQDIQDTRLRDDRRRVLRVRLAALNGLISSYYANPLRTAETEYKPHFCDFIFMPEIREVIESSNEAELGPHCENALRVLLPTLIARWEAQTRRKLTRLLQPSARSSKGTDVLELAVTHFTCTECQCLLPYPEVLAHPCLRQLRPQPRPRDKSRCSHPFPKEDMVYEISTWEIGVMREPWSSSALCVPDAPFEEHLRNVIALSGRDPASVTRRELDALDVHLVHRNKKQSRLIPLRAVINFEWERFKATESSHWVPKYEGHTASEAELTKGKLKKASQVSFVERHKAHRYWCCSLCMPYDDNDPANSRLTTLSNVQTHMQMTHSNENTSVEMGDIYCHPQIMTQPLRKQGTYPMV